MIGGQRSIHATDCTFNGSISQLLAVGSMLLVLTDDLHLIIIAMFCSIIISPKNLIVMKVQGCWCWLNRNSCVSIAFHEKIIIYFPFHRFNWNGVLVVSAHMCAKFASFLELNYKIINNCVRNGEMQEGPKIRCARASREKQRSIEWEQ